MSGFNTLIDKKIRGSIADWNQNDSSADDYVKNRPFYEELVQPAPVFDAEIELVDKERLYLESSFVLEELKEYKVIFDDVEYIVNCYYDDTDSSPVLDLADGDDWHLRIFSRYGECFIDAYGISGIHTIKIIDPEAQPYVRVKQLDKKYLPDGISSKPDWNQNDESAADYIKNRPFYTSVEWLTWSEGIGVKFEDGCVYLNRDNDIWPSVGDFYKVEYDGVEYSGTVWEDGDACMRTDFTTDDGTNFNIYDGYIVFTSPAISYGTHTIKISVGLVNIQKIPDEYINFPVISVNGQQGYVNITASSINAATKSEIDGINKSIDEAIAQKAQVQIVTWESDD